MQKFREKLPSYGKREVSLKKKIPFIDSKGPQILNEKNPNLSLSSAPQELVELIQSDRVLVVSGETGCGKTTQVTQFILDDYISRGVGSTCRVVCTQPRRISAISVRSCCCSVVMFFKLLHVTSLSVCVCFSQVAERVAAERAESVGNGNSCGYQIRLQRYKSLKEQSSNYNCNSFAADTK